ncbi:MAG: hypothetical protein ROZ37_06245 [Aromatoleum sp.]|jgi:hypothetical protein|uniref:hypothetical protein n=1 Tax=Aromatoleum sp. TaxID=2307007 RepID=UPI002893AE88|nr:hypothetical protein [Aromatoleum sp.]MDT3669914.1 hypothetical protein [Aromatoleum sp.]
MSEPVYGIQCDFWPDELSVERLANARRMVDEHAASEGRLSAGPASKVKPRAKRVGLAEPGVSMSPDSSVTPLPDWLPSAAWTAFVRMRGIIGAPLTPRAINLALNALAKLRVEGYEPDEVLRHAVMQRARRLLAPCNLALPLER